LALKDVEGPADDGGGWYAVVASLKLGGGGPVSSFLSCDLPNASLNLPMVTGYSKYESGGASNT
jgi:hypothetical protein